MAECSPMFPQSSPGKGEQESLFSTLKSQRKSIVPPCSPISGTKEVICNNTGMDIRGVSRIYNNRDFGGNMGEHFKTDLRLKSERFRRAIRLVFSYLGIENTVRNFQKWDNQIAWEEFAHNIQNPTKTARVNVLWHGEKSGAVITVKLPGRTRAEAIKKIDTKRYKFVEWTW